MRAALLLIGALLSAAVQARAQDAPACAESAVRPLSGMTYRAARDRALLGGPRIGSEFVRQPLHSSLGCTRPNGIRLAPVALQSTFNSTYPQDRNNGALWSGRGAAAALTAGVEAKWGPFELVLAPALLAEENRAFDLAPLFLPGYSSFANAGHPGTIDWPQRFGAEQRTAWSPGQSGLRITAGPLRAGAGTQNMWLGPAVFYPILLSNTGEGFPHAYLSLPSVSLPIGQLGISTFWGRLDESDYFDDVAANDTRIIHGLALELEPAFARGLWLGFSRLYTMSRAGRSTADFLLRPFGISDDPLRSVEDNGIFALYARYVLPAAQAEVYAEWAHEAGYASLVDFLREPDQTQAYTLGLQKLIGPPERQLRVYGESTHLETASPLRGGRGLISYYTHAGVTQGHTHKGQLLGSWIGPGSDAQRVGVDVLRPRRTIGFYAERNRFDADAYYDQWAVYYDFNGHDAQAMLGARARWEAGAFEMLGDASFARRYNRSFVRLNGSQPMPATVDHNWSAEIVLRWNPRSAARNSP